jgi:hypothetical protein
VFSSPFQNFHFPCDLYQIRPANSWKGVTNHCTSPWNSIGVDKLILLASCRCLAGHIHIFADLSSKLKSSWINGCSLFIEPNAYKRAKEQNGSKDEARPPSSCWWRWLTVSLVAQLSAHRMKVVIRRGQMSGRICLNDLDDEQSQQYSCKFH